MSDPSIYPFVDVVRLIATYADGSEAQFSGTLISPDEILTVSHGLYYSPTEQVAESVAVQVQTDPNAAPVTVADTSSFHFNRISYGATIAPSQTASDFALIHVPGGLPLPGGSGLLDGIGVYPNFSGGNLDILGYPAYAGGALEGDNEPISPDPTPGVLDMGYDGVVAPGSSGGPLAGLLSNGEAVLVGMVSTETTAVGLNSADVNLLDAWLAQDGDGPFLSPTAATPSDPIFDAAWYLAHNPDVAAAHVDPFQHYMTFGWREGRDPSPYFHTVYYLNQNPDVAAAGVNPLTHFETNGFAEGRDPSVDFSLAAYRAANPQVPASFDPLVDFLHAGLALGRMAFTATPHATGPTDPLIDPSYYYGSNADVAAFGIDPTTHYDATGWHEGRNPDSLFNTDYYLGVNRDVAAAGVNPMQHYEIFGWHEGRNPSAAFDGNAYLAHNPDVAAGGWDPLIHYLEHGQFEGRAIYAVGASNLVG